MQQFEKVNAQVHTEIYISTHCEEVTPGTSSFSNYIRRMPKEKETWQGLLNSILCWLNRRSRRSRTLIYSF